MAVSSRPDSIVIACFCTKRGRQMQRNMEKCGHCGLALERPDDTPLVNRSDGRTFHLSLLSKHVLHVSSVPAGTILCNFEYAFDQLEARPAVTVILLAGDRREVGIADIESVADKLAKLLDLGERPNAAYLEFPE
jgi:hypothetical protein